MWNELWFSLGRATGLAARSIGGMPGPAPSESAGKTTGRIRRGAIRASYAMVFLGVAAARLCGATSRAFRARAILICSGVQVSLGALAQMLSSISSPSPSVKAVVGEQAEGIARVLSERDVAPGRIGIDGIPGSGKSTLARALVERLDMKWKSLDFRNLGIAGDLEQERTIYEHHRLFRTQDVDAFDVIIYIDESARCSKARTRRRGRGLILAFVLDYEKLKKVGKLAFDVCEGEPVAIPGSPLVLKIRPPGGFRAVENITSSLRASGLDASGMSKEEMLCLLACGKRQEGLRAYLLPLEYIARIGALVARLRSAGRRFIAVLCADDSIDDNETDRAGRTASLADALRS